MSTSASLPAVASSPSRMLPTVATTRTLPEPAAKVSSVIFPLLVCSEILPLVVVLVTVGFAARPVDCDMVMAMAATRSIVFPLVEVRMSAFCSTLRPALTLMFSALLMRSAFSVMSEPDSPDCTSTLPAAEIPRSLVSPWFTVIPPAVVTKTRCPADTMSEKPASVIAVPFTAPVFSTD